MVVLFVLCLGVVKNKLCCWRLMYVFIVLVPIGKIAAHSAYDMFHGISA